MAFETFPTHIHIWASKSLSNFAGIAYRIHQCGLWDSPNFRCCLDQIESDATHMLYCANTNLAAIREDLIERLIENMIKLEGDQCTMQVLLQHMLHQPSQSPPHLVHLSSHFNRHYLRALWYVIFTQ